MKKKFSYPMLRPFCEGINYKLKKVWNIYIDINPWIDLAYLIITMKLEVWSWNT